MKTMYYDTGVIPDGLVGTLGFLIISLFFTLLEISLPQVDAWLNIIVHLSQLTAAIVAICVGWNTLKQYRTKNRNKPI
jgi:hypothetical protein